MGGYMEIRTLKYNVTVGRIELILNFTDSSKLIYTKITLQKHICELFNIVESSRVCIRYVASFFGGSEKTCFIVIYDTKLGIFNMENGYQKRVICLESFRLGKKNRKIRIIKKKS